MKTKPTKNKTDINVIGILELFVVASVLFMAYIVIMGVDDVVAKVCTVPALIWCVVVLVNKFSK